MSLRGLDATRLARIPTVMQGHVERGVIAGAVTLVARGDEVRVDAVGARDRESGAPMKRDAIFRVASMTKPVVAVAAMMLVEEAKVRLDDPIDRVVPEMANRRVLRTPESPLDDTVPARRPITLRDLLTCQMGLGLVVGSRPDTPIQLALDDAGLLPHPNPPPFSPDDLAARYGRLPLVHQPGDRWMYHNGFDVLAVLVARVAGKPLDVVLRERVFEPLGMRDTGYDVPEAKMDRLAACYQPSLRTGALAAYDDGQKGRPSRAMTPAGGTGLFSTADDFLAFGRMMLRFGRHGSTRLLARPSVEAMVTDQVPDAQKPASPFFPGFWDSYGWGLGLAMITRRTGPWASPGRFGWEGGLGTTWFSDPREDLVGVLLTQRYGNPLGALANLDFATLAYQSLDD